MEGKILPVVWASKWGQECRGNGLWEGVGYMNTSGNRDRQVAYITVLEEFDDAVVTTSSWNLFQEGTAWTLNACWRWGVSNFCLLSINEWLRSQWWFGRATGTPSGISRWLWVIINIEIRFPRIYRWVRENRELVYTGYGEALCMNFFTSFCTFLCLCIVE